jgi:tetratricopeptide (TPR) repeat protein
MPTYIGGQFIALLVATIFLWPLAAGAQQSKTIQDPAEYAAYMGALNAANPAQKAAAMEAFLKSYPASILRIDALRAAMAAFQLAGDAAKVEELARRVLQAEPADPRSMAILIALKRGKAAQGDSRAAGELLADATTGLNALVAWTKPGDINEGEYAKLKNQMTEIFNGAAGFGALQAKDYAKARDYYLKAVKSNPADLPTVYQLGFAELEMTPPDVNGFWHISRAMSFAQAQNNAAARESMERYGKAKYKKYHGSEDGWDQIVMQAAKQTTLPATFAKSIKAAPTPAEFIVAAVKDNDPATLSFSDWELVLSYRDASPANKDAAAKVWQALQAKQKNGAAMVKLPVKVISATPDAIEAAITDDNQQASKADLHVIMEKPMSQPPKP